MSKYEIISSSSAGNSIMYFGSVLVDVGVPFNRLTHIIENIKYVLLTHQHGDHINKSTIKTIGSQFPNIILVVPEKMLEFVLKLKVKMPIFVIKSEHKYMLAGNIILEAFDLFHDVPNVGYKLIQSGYKIVHATDTNMISHVSAKNFDLYAIEHNHDEELLKQDIISRLGEDAYIHEIRSRDTHLSFQKAKQWIDSQKKEDSEVILLHVGSSYQNL